MREALFERFFADDRSALRNLSRVDPHPNTSIEPPGFAGGVDRWAPVVATVGEFLHISSVGGKRRAARALIRLGGRRTHGRPRLSIGAGAFDRGFLPSLKSEFTRFTAHFHISRLRRYPKPKMEGEMIRAPAIVAGLVLMVLPASADWRYAKWGMTKTQIIAASKGEAREFRIGDDFVCAFSGLKIMAIVPRKDISGTPFDVSFCSSANGRLSSVSLNALGANINLFKRTMVSQYGRPLSDTGGITIWNDEKARNTVTLIDVVGVAVRIEYKPMGGSGL